MAEDMAKQIRRLERKLQRYRTVEVARASSSAINRVTKMVRTEVVRKVSKGEKLPAKAVRRKTFIKRSTAKSQRATFTAYTTDVSVAGLMRPSTLKSKAGRGTSRKGVRAAGRTFPGAFINPGANGRLMVYQRKGKARHPIQVVKISIREPVRRAVPSISQRLMRTDYRRLYANDLKFRVSKYER